MVERCKKKHWWSHDPHSWTTIEGYLGSCDGIRNCDTCGLMQIKRWKASAIIEWDNGKHVQIDTTKKEFDHWRSVFLKKKQEYTKKQNKENCYVEQIESDRLDNIKKGEK